MEHRSEHLAAVVELDAPLADAVVAALERRGCPAWTAEGDDGRIVLVHRDRRDEALRLVGDAMDELAATAPDRAAQRSPRPRDEEEPGRRLVLPRLRDTGIAILLIPLLIVSLSAVRIPRTAAVVLVVVGVGVIAFLRMRTRRDDT